MLNPTHVSKRENYIFLVIFIIIICITIADVIRDFGEGLSFVHISHEIGIVILSSVLIFYQVRILHRKNKSMAIMHTTVDALSLENQKIQDELKKFSGQFHELINQQLVAWQLSVSEKDVSRLILKGLSMKEIAEIRQTSEATVRQQAMNIYRKANVHSRQEFIAYFLEDL